MSTAETNRPSTTPDRTAPDRTTPTTARGGRPVVPTRRSIYPKGACPAPTATLPAVIPPAGASCWRRQAVTEELPAVPSRRGALPRRPSRRTTLRRHLRAALAGTLLAVVAVTGLSAYAAQGVADARQNAPCQARTSCR